MMQPQISRIELQGFRSFGKTRQIFDPSPTVSVLWGGNSQGKTSFAEALEFLLTGQIARRELQTSMKDEFAEALRNAHIGDGPVVVEAQIWCSDGKARRLTRTLVEDYRRGSAAGCASRLEIDGKVCTEEEIERTLGLRLSHAPLRAPVLGQNTLGYVFSASPAERAAYFRAILDTQDLEDFRIAVAALQPLLTAPILPELHDLAAVGEIPALAATVGGLRRADKQVEVEKRLLTNCSALLVSVRISPEASLAGRVDQIDKELDRRRAQTFPMTLLGRANFARWNGPPATVNRNIDTFLAERAKIDAETRRLVDLFRAALALPDHPADHDAQDCPLCGAADTFTAERIAFIREKVKETEAYTKAAENFQAGLRAVDGELDALMRSFGQAHPRFMREPTAARRTVGFSLSHIRDLVCEEATVTAWVAAVRSLSRAGYSLRRVIKSVIAELQAALADAEQWSGMQALEDGFAAITERQKQFELRLLEYTAPGQAIGQVLKAAVDESANTKGWEALLRLCRNPSGLCEALAAVAVHAAKVKGLETALNEIDTGNGRVLDEKFEELSKGVLAWWDRLRPDEPAFFDAVQRRNGQARRTIDLKVGLSAKEDRSEAKFRNAVAVFSQSQLHCLGLSLFLARAVEESAGFVILDDPVLSSDDDYRPNFVSSVIEGLLDEGIQVIVCTQDHKSWKDIGDRWGYRGAMQFQLVLHDVVHGTEIRSQNDDLATMIAKAQPLVKSRDPLLRKEGAGRLREALERFGKIILVKDRQGKGESLASITDYDGKNFSSYSQQVMNLLTEDPAHPGKFKAAHDYVTPGPHDDKPPSAGELAVAFGDLKKLKRDYLD
jgi:hypothetical protein